jgi:hypothetical protein
MAFNPAGTVTLRPSASDPLDNPQTAGVLSVDTASELTLSGLAMEDGTYMSGSIANTITARAGGTQALATQLAAQYNRISVCASAADSVALPDAPIGTAVWVRNDGANSAQVFGITPQTINGVATATGVALAAAAAARYVRLTATAWYAF